MIVDRDEIDTVWIFTLRHSNTEIYSQDKLVEKNKKKPNNIGLYIMNVLIRQHTNCMYLSAYKVLNKAYKLVTSKWQGSHYG